MDFQGTGLQNASKECSRCGVCVCGVFLPCGRDSDQRPAAALETFLSGTESWCIAVAELACCALHFPQLIRAFCPSIWLHIFKPAVGPGMGWVGASFHNPELENLSWDLPLNWLLSPGWVEKGTDSCFPLDGVSLQIFPSSLKVRLPFCLGFCNLLGGDAGKSGFGCCLTSLKAQQTFLFL